MNSNLTELLHYADKQQKEFNTNINESLNNIENNIYTNEDLKNEIIPILKNINERLTILEDKYNIVNNINQ